MRKLKFTYSTLASPAAMQLQRLQKRVPYLQGPST